MINVQYKCKREERGFLGNTTKNKGIRDTLRRRVLYPMVSSKHLLTSKALSRRPSRVARRTSQRANGIASEMTYSRRCHCRLTLDVDSGVLSTSHLGVGNIFSDVMERALGKLLISYALSALEDIIILIF